MAEAQVFLVHSEGDIIHARLKTRSLAQALGMKIADQARISLAVSSLAHQLGLGQTRKGRIVIERLNQGERTGIQVQCFFQDGVDGGGYLKSLHDKDWMLMVDELTFEMLPSENVSVKAIKWAL